MLRRVMAFVIVAVIVTVAVRLAPDRPVGSAVASLGAPQALLASPSAGTPEGTPDLGVEVPAEIQLDLVASVPVEDLPTGPVSIRLDRVELAAGQEIVAGGDAPQVLAVESGEVTVAGDGLSGTVWRRRPDRRSGRCHRGNPQRRIAQRLASAPARSAGVR